jgi:hypothetical protein
METALLALGQDRSPLLPAQIREQPPLSQIPFHAATFAEEREEQVKEEAEQTTERSKVEGEEDLEKTVIMNLNDLDSVLSDAKSSIAGSEQQNATPQIEDVTNEDLSETVIISLEELEKLKKGKNGHK